MILDLCTEFEDDSEVIVVVAGQGRGYDWLQKEKNLGKADNLNLLPLQPFAVFQYVLASADVTVALLEEDAGAYAVPSKVLNYMCAGKPILISSPLSNQAAAVVSQNKLGVATPSGNSRLFKLAAREMFQNVNDLREYSDKSRQYAVSNFDIDVIAKKFLKVLKGNSKK